MLKQISVERYRAFAEKTTIELRPITILLGRNSSGKSSITRLFPLFQQSLETPSSSPILWAADEVDLGNIADIKTHDYAGELRFSFKISGKILSDFLIRFQHFTTVDGLIEKVDFDDTEFTIRLDGEQNRTKLKGFEISIGAQTVRIDCKPDGLVTSIRIGKKEMLLEGLSYHIDTTELFPTMVRISEDDPRIVLHHETFYPPILGALKNVIHGRTSFQKLVNMADEFPYLPAKVARGLIAQVPNVVERKVTRENARALSDASLVNDIHSIIDCFQLMVAGSLRNVSYIGPYRATSQRFSRIQELAVNQIDSTGANVAMYLYSLTKKELSSFNILMEKASGFIVEVKASGPGHISVNIGRRSKDHFENIADVGFGFSQILPVIAQLHSLIERTEKKARLPFARQRIFAVEQPELHLHPALQSNLADLFVEAFASHSNETSSSIFGILETHSQSMIQRFSELVAEGVLSPHDISLVFIEKDADGELSTARQMEFDDTGIIEDWPIGFFTT